MKQELKSDIATLLDRADVTDKKTPVPARPLERERRHVYGGGDPQAKTPGYPVRPRNQIIAARKRRSTFNIIAALFLSAIAIIAYINNILTVNQLAVEVHQLQLQYDNITNTNDVLRSDINRKSSWEHIGNAATGQLGLKYAKEHPVMLDVDEDKLDKFMDK